MGRQSSLPDGLQTPAACFGSDPPPARNAVATIFETNSTRPAAKSFLSSASRNRPAIPLSPPPATKVGPFSELLANSPLPQRDRCTRPNVAISVTASHPCGLVRTPARLKRRFQLFVEIVPSTGEHWLEDITLHHLTEAGQGPVGSVLASCFLFCATRTAAAGAPVLITQLDRKMFLSVYYRPHHFNMWHMRRTYRDALPDTLHSPCWGSPLSICVGTLGESRRKTDHSADHTLPNDHGVNWSKRSILVGG